ncbi:transposase [Luteimonas viscosa]|uniref:transposase n=1 Tax=Luteimonas viscosa TaxID=1132694 RepID=UPI0021CD1781|nr:transposase [Luteimonas viscosa]
MPRPPRFDLPGIAQHVVQRGREGAPCFVDDIDRLHYLRELRDVARREYCRVHAYVLMPDHVHLLLTPMAAGRVGRLVQQLGRRYVRRFNARHRRSGALWQARYAACPVLEDRYLLACQRYIECNPVRAGLVGRPAQYPWSSHRAHAFAEDDLVSPHRAWLALGADAATRRRAWHAWSTRPVAAAETDAIREHLRCQRLHGPARFRGAGPTQRERVPTSRDPIIGGEDPRAFRP